LFTRNILSGCKRHPAKTISRRTEAAKSAKKQSLVDKPQPFAANPFNLIKRKGLIGVAASKTDQYPRACHQSLPVPRGRLKTGQARRRPQGMCFPSQGLQRSMARFQAPPGGPGLIVRRAALLGVYLE
jgi:hypothetical protein